MDKFPEAFDRFEEVVDVDKIDSFRELKAAFSSWAGSKWLNTSKQNSALRVEARRIGITVEGTVRAMFSRKFSSFSSWSERRARTSVYQRRIMNYMKAHPNATLSEARGHRRR